MSTAVTVDHLSKTYRLGTIGGGTLAQDLSRWWARVRKKPDPFAKVDKHSHVRQTGDVFRALDDVSFDVHEGEVLGIIGRNGAGKSTLLKILSQVTGPTSGRIELHGRVASLLEVGTGFHPDLTGRENIYLNGAILGMTRSEIRRKFDEIVAFSECETFIDTPVKRYSSGMYVRLAFAVAAHLEPEILIVDEVLAVGDAQFQNKCLGKMGEVSRGGRTVLFVSHNMGAVRRLCQRAVLLNDGRVSMVGNSDVAVARYLGGVGTSSGSWVRETPAPDSAYAYMTALRVTNAAGEVASTIASTEPVTITVVVEARDRTRPIQIAFRLTNHEGIPVFSSANTDEEHALIALAPGEHQYRITIPGSFLPAGSYNVWMVVHIPRTAASLFDSVDSVNFMIEDTGTIIDDGRLGVVTPRLHWQHTLRSDHAASADSVSASGAVPGARRA